MPRSLAIRSLSAAEAEFLSAGRNEELIEEATGAGSKGKKNAALWDAASVRYGVPCSTWREAFRACCAGRQVLGQRSETRQQPDGSTRQVHLRQSRIERSWSTFDLETLRECVPGLDLPDWVYEQQADAALDAWAAGMAELADSEQEAWYAPGGGADEEAAGEAVQRLLARSVEGGGPWGYAGEYDVTEDMIEGEQWGIVVIEGALQASDAQLCALFGIEIEPARPPLPAWAWR